jgi:hypothetical protein
MTTVAPSNMSRKTKSGKQYKQDRRRRERILNTFPFLSDQQFRIIEVLEDTSEELGYRVREPTLKKMVKQAAKAKRNETIMNNREFGVAIAALIAFSAEEAALSRQHTIKPKHVDKGWNANSTCPGTCPPHKCFRRSVFQVEDTLRQNLPIFRELSVQVHTVVS